MVLCPNSVFCRPAAIPAIIINMISQLIAIKITDQTGWSVRKDLNFPIISFNNNYPDNESKSNRRHDYHLYPADIRFADTVLQQVLNADCYRSLISYRS